MLYLTSLLGSVIGLSYQMTATYLYYFFPDWLHTNTIMFVTYVSVGALPFVLLLTYWIWTLVERRARIIASGLGRLALASVFERINHTFWELGDAILTSPV
ncbi:hypothetical protein GALMADRAFT_1291647 [Galerina marginata CBS 339.88]|uniref:Uncharacterized protein n=1 Tax=Galerina marginata (strain CBS 339.88) TaxID=685588 RepID=A0A067S3S3_GALM3|nr:hypothetical protein GALMADRAFT_1291647 [Galerina marginata CBS 339.88]